MSLSSNVVRRGAVYYARMRVPKDLIKTIGRSELFKSLKTRDPIEALSRARVLIARWQLDFDSRRNGQELTEEAAVSLSRFYYQDILRMDLVGRTMDQQSGYDRLSEHAEKL